MDNRECVPYVSRRSPPPTGSAVSCAPDPTTAAPDMAKDKYHQLIRIKPRKLVRSAVVQHAQAGRRNPASAAPIDGSPRVIHLVDPDPEAAFEYATSLIAKRKELRISGTTPGQVSEVLIGGLPPYGSPDAWPFERERQYFVDALEFVRQRAGPHSLIFAAAIHRDEARPHMHVTLVPAVEGTLKPRGKPPVKTIVLGSKQWEQAVWGRYANRTRGTRIQDDFHASVASSYGLLRGQSWKETGARNRPLTQAERERAMADRWLGEAQQWEAKSREYEALVQESRREHEQVQADTEKKKREADEHVEKQRGEWRSVVAARDALLQELEQLRGKIETARAEVEAGARNLLTRKPRERGRELIEDAREERERAASAEARAVEAERRADAAEEHARAVEREADSKADEKYQQRHFIAVAEVVRDVVKREEALDRRESLVEAREKNATVVRLRSLENQISDAKSKISMLREAKMTEAYQTFKELLARHKVNRLRQRMENHGEALSPARLAKMHEEVYLPELERLNAALAKALQLDNHYRQVDAERSESRGPAGRCESSVVGYVVSGGEDSPDEACRVAPGCNGPRLATARRTVERMGFECKRRVDPFNVPTDAREDLVWLDSTVRSVQGPAGRGGSPGCNGSCLATSRRKVGHMGVESGGGAPCRRHRESLFSGVSEIPCLGCLGGVCSVRWDGRHCSSSGRTAPSWPTAIPPERGHGAISTGGPRARGP